MSNLKLVSQIVIFTAFSLKIYQNKMLCLLPGTKRAKHNYLASFLITYQGGINGNNM